MCIFRWIIPLKAPLFGTVGFKLVCSFTHSLSPVLLSCSFTGHHVSNVSSSRHE